MIRTTVDRSKDVQINSLSPQAARLKFRTQGYTGTTSGYCDGALQCNLIVLPEPLAQPFERYCLSNPLPCPLVAHAPSAHGGFEALGKGLDIRTDLPLYNIINGDSVVGQVPDLLYHWQADLHAFAIGCSFTFERALINAGIAIRHIEEQKTVPMFRTDIETIRSGPFGGPMVVSMRPIQVSDVNRVKEICQAFPHAHGAPIHIGDPGEIGISDVMHPDWGDPVEVTAGEVPVFWGCGVTSQMAVLQAKPEIAFSHAPGAMLITDWPETPPSDYDSTFSPTTNPTQF